MKEFVKEANTIIFDFMWKVKDKVKRSALISDIEDGGLKAPHLIAKEYFAARNWQIVNR